MGENTVREILKRRGKDTQRALQRRRELAQGGGKRPLWPKLVLALVLIAILAGVGGTLYLAHEVNDRFLVSRAARSSDTALNLSSTTEFLPNTLLAVTDPDFYNEHGFGGTPLTRLLVRTYYPGNPRTRNRIMATTLDLRYSKTDLLQEFINNVPFGEENGQAVHGFGAASLLYFGKPFAQLEPQDIALLVAVMRDPAGLDPRRSPDQALEARNAVLQAAMQQSILSEAQEAALIQTPLGVTAAPAP